MLHETLWNENRDQADACLAHPFVRGLGDGSLPPDTFKRYVAQDAFFLRAFAQAYAVALAKCEPIEHVRELHAFIGGALHELQLHAKYAATLGIDLARVRPLPATSAYVNFLQRTAWQMDTGPTLAAMTPCMRLYAFLGQRLADRLRPNHPYADWVRTYSSDDFEQLARRVEALLDETAPDTAPVHTAYRYALQCELAFFDGARTPPT